MKLLYALISIVALFLGSQLDSGSQTYQTYFGATDKPQTAVQAIPASATFARGFTDNQNQPCSNSQGGHYESDILSREEIEHNLRLAGFTPEQAHLMQAIAKAESGHQLNCFGDESLVTSKWAYSYGLYQIRGLKAETGKGTCRDVERLRLNVLEQSKCAYEISGGGTNFRPWSVYLNGKYRQWL